MDSNGHFGSVRPAPTANNIASAAIAAADALWPPTPPSGRSAADLPLSQPPAPLNPPGPAPPLGGSTAPVRHISHTSPGPINM